MATSHFSARGPLSPGQKLADTFEIVELLRTRKSQLGLTWIYEGHQRDVERKVEVQVLARPFSSNGQREARQRFMREARIVSQLKHPDVLALFDLGLTQEHSLPYMVTEWMPGLTLRELLAEQGPMSAERTLPLFVRCLQVLGQAHARGVVHRDLIPDNLLLTHPGTRWERLRIHHFALIFDTHSENARLTGTNDLAGSPRYLAPEYLMHGVVKPQMDVYQMGLLLVEVLAGEPVVKARNDMACAQAHVKGELSVPDALRAGSLGPILERALAHDHEARFANAAEFARALSQVDPAEAFNARRADPLADHYDVGELIGEGGFAMVFAGVDRRDQRPVAIKVMKPRPESKRHAEFVSRFTREATLCQRLRHPHLVEVYDVGVSAEGLPFMAMERLKGQDLGQLLDAEGGLEPARAISLTLQTLDALSVAHALGIVHKDLKPCNIFLHRPSPSEPELLKVLDFGIARMGEDEETRLTRTGQPACTPNYAAPEYITDLTVTPALDVYQVALILVEMLTGDPVVRGNNPIACIMAHVRSALHLPPFIMEGPLGPLVGRALARDHTKRYSDAHAFAHALRQVDVSLIAPSDQSDAQPGGDAQPSVDAETVTLNPVMLRVSKSFVAALTISRGAPHDIERLAPLYAECIQYAAWPVDDRKWRQLSDMLEASAQAARGSSESHDLHAIEQLLSALERRLQSPSA